jgi:DNA-binding response OmpR family regulator
VWIPSTAQRKIGKDAMNDTGCRRILLVDDDAMVLEAVQTGLTSAGEDVLACGTFEAARAALRSKHFDVLLTDVRLGAFNGLQLAVIAREVQPLIRIVVFSGFEDSVLRREAMAVDATYLVKPVSLRQLALVLDAEACSC